MPQIKNIERKILAVEGFAVVIMKDGKNMRSDAVLPVQYNAQRMTKNSATVSDFKAKFRSQFPGYDVEVLRGDGTIAAGQMLLSTVRESYLVE